ncbi:aminodeoxychorismate lyase [Pseudidiomarina aestuarii]|uniref:Aminodeoxychorismate lyase n=1 Tax=Pseudidiomarina aestuarii TaxID=624146 RepID=A0A2T4D688_9GAMM|nr:aminodeoxychorismate lyase [Pseudidiomarina aestuarii]
MLWKNGQLLTAPAFDRGLQFGDGHFTTLTIRHSQVLWWPLHWQRLCQAADKLELPLPPQATITDFLQTIASTQPQCVVKLMMTAGDSSRGYARQSQAEPHWYASVSPIPEVPTQPLKMQLARLKLAEQPAFAGLKTLNRLEQVMLTQELNQRDCDELVVTDQSEAVVESISSNVFWRCGEQWFTPSLVHAGINGVARTQLLNENILGTVEIVRAGTDVLFTADQVFLVNSVMGPRPVAEFQGHPFSAPILPKGVSTWWQSEISLSF